MATLKIASKWKSRNNNNICFVPDSAGSGPDIIMGSAIASIFHVLIFSVAKASAFAKPQKWSTANTRLYLAFVKSACRYLPEIVNRRLHFMKKKIDPEPLPTDTPITQIDELGEQLADAFAKKYLAVGGKSAAAVVELAETVWEAGDQLSPRQLRIFYEKVRLDPKGSTVVKLRAIGENADRFKPHLDFLPNNWTSLYRLSRIPLADFVALIESKQLHAASTMNDINEALGKRTSKARKPLNLVIRAGVIVEPSQRAALAQELAALAKKYKAPLSAPGHAEDLQKLLNDPVELGKAA